MHFGLRGRIAGCAIKSCQAGDDLPQHLTGPGAIRIVPSAHIFAGGRKTRALPVHFQQPVLIELHVGGVDLVPLRLQRASRELHFRVGKDRKFFPG